MDLIFGNLMANSISEIAESWIVDDVSSSDGGDLSTWEMIDPSDDETLDFPLSEPESEPESVSAARSLSKSPPKRKPPIVLERFGCNYYNHNLTRHRHVDDQDESDEYETSDDNGLDDELVPKNVGDLLGRNRMRKLGKREYSKMAKSKKLPVVYNRPGCVRGKHGLGLKHSLM